MILKSLSSFNDAFVNRAYVEVYLDGEQIGEGIIEQHTKEALIINGDHYLKRNCEFYIK